MTKGTTSAAAKKIAESYLTTKPPGKRRATVKRKAALKARVSAAQKKRPARKAASKKPGPKPYPALTRSLTAARKRKPQAKRKAVPKMKTTKRKPGRPRFRPTDKQRIMVETLAAVGHSQETILRLIQDWTSGGKMSEPTLRKHFRDELDLGLAKANQAVAANIYRIATAFPPLPGTVLAANSWMNNRGDWSTKHIHQGGAKPIEHKHGLIEDDQTLAGIIDALRECGVIPHGEAEG